MSSTISGDDRDIVMKENGAEENKEAAATAETTTATATDTATAAATPPPSSAPAKNPEAENLKEEGNKMFADKHFQKAIDLYTKGLPLIPPQLLLPSHHQLSR